MFHTLRQFISGFLSRSGSSVFIAMLSARVMSFLASWIALQLVNETDLGLVFYAYSFFTFLNPIGGLGLNHSFMRYAALHQDEAEKHNYFHYTLLKGIKIALGFIFLIFLLVFAVYRNQTDLMTYFMILSFNLFSIYIIELVKNYFRVFHQNKNYAWLEITYNFLLVLLVIILGWQFKAVGYSLALVLAPLLAVLVFLPKIKIQKQYKKPTERDGIFWKFAFYSGMAGVASQLLFNIDLIFIGNLMQDPVNVTHYKYVSLIPYSLLFIPSMFITADFVKLIEEAHDKAKIKTYINQFWTFFLMISIGVLIFAFAFPKLILSLFRADLEQYVLTFRILMVGVIGVLLFRGLFGNLLASIGKSHINFWIALGTLVVNAVLNLYLIPKYGITGAAITSAIVMWTSGLLSYFLFNYYFREKIVSGFE
jgi:O-antigen/teichoic acid export membrane protein